MSTPALNGDTYGTACKQKRRMCSEMSELMSNPALYPLVSHVPLSVTLDPGAGRPWLDCMPTVLHRNALAPATRVEAL